jgi:hypothetical protein
MDGKKFHQSYMLAQSDHNANCGKIRPCEIRGVMKICTRTGRSGKEVISIHLISGRQQLVESGHLMKSTDLIPYQLSRSNQSSNVQAEQGDWRQGQRDFFQSCLDHTQDL